MRSPGAADTHRQAIHILRFNQVVHLRKANIQRVAVDRHLWRNSHWFVGQNVGQNMSKRQSSLVTETENDVLDETWDGHGFGNLECLEMMGSMR